MGKWGWGWTGDCGCCDGDPPIECGILSDDFTRENGPTLGDQWDERSGSWAINTNSAETSSANSLAVSVDGLASPADPYRIASMMGGHYGGSLAFDYLDDDNYHYVLRGPGGSFGEVSLYKVESGSHSLVASASLVSADYTAGLLQISFCVTGGQIILNLGDDNRNVTWTTSLYGGDKAGIGSESLTGTATFGSFTFTLKATPDNPDCPDCVSDCVSDACLDEAPLFFAVDFGAPGFLANDECSLCEDFGGEYILTHRLPPIAVPCVWRYSQGWCPTRYESCPPVDKPLNMTITITPAFPGFRFRLNVDGSSPITDPDCGGVLDQFRALYQSEVFLDPIECLDISEVTLTRFQQQMMAMCTGSLPSTVTMSAVQ